MIDLRTPKEAAAALRCSIKTLNLHVRSGALRYVIIGGGAKRPRRMFTDQDLADFIEAQRRRDVPCPSTDRKVRRSTISTSGTVVRGFMARLEQRTSEKQKA